MKSQEDQARDAIALFKRFHRREPRPGDIVVVSGLEPPTVALKVGTFVGIAYRALDGHEFMHYFENNRPLVHVNSDGDQIYILGGGYRFGERGFEG